MHITQLLVRSKHKLLEPKDLHLAAEAHDNQQVWAKKPQLRESIQSEISDEDW